MTGLVAAYGLPLLLGFCVGAAFALLSLPVPAPPTAAGLLGVVGMTVGYLALA